MMHPTDTGLVVICGAWDDVNRYIIDNGLDPDRVIKPHGATLAYPMSEDQVIILDGWEPDGAEAEWFWNSVALRMFTPDDSNLLFQRALHVSGLVPESFR